MRRAVHVLMTGRVQGVGFRAWTEREAVSRGLDGWVRNRRDGGVEAVFAGGAETVEAMLAALQIGPRDALVTEVVARPHDAAVAPGFGVLPTA